MANNDALLPDRRNEAAADLFAIGGVAREIGEEKAFFIEKARGEDDEEQWNEKERPERAKREGRGDEKNQSSHVHGMAHDSIESG